MKIHKMKKIKSIILGIGIAIILMMGMQGTKVNAAEAQLCHIDSISLSLDGSLALNVYMSVPTDASRVVIGNTEYEITNKHRNHVKKYTVRVNAKDISEKQEIHVFNQYDREIAFDNMVGSTQIAYSAQDYIDTIISNASEYSEKTVNLCNALNAYGKGAKDYFDPSVKITDKEVKGISGYDYQIDELPEDIKYLGSSLVLKDFTTIRHYFLGDADNYKIKIAGEEVVPVKCDDLFYIDISNIQLMDWDRNFPLVISNNEGNYTLKYSVMSYCQLAAMQNIDLKLVALANTMEEVMACAKEYDSWGICIVEDLPDEICVTNFDRVELKVEATGAISYEWYEVKNNNYNEWEYVGAGEKYIYSYSDMGPFSGNRNVFKCVLTDEKGNSIESNWVRVTIGNVYENEEDYMPVVPVPSVYFDVNNSWIVMGNYTDEADYYTYIEGINGSIDVGDFIIDDNGICRTEKIKEINDNGKYTIIVDIHTGNNWRGMYEYSFELDTDKKLSIPQNVKYNNGYISWDGVEDADSYKVTVYWLYDDEDTPSWMELYTTGESIYAANLEYGCGEKNIVGCKIMSLSDNLSEYLSSDESGYIPLKEVEFLIDSIWARYNKSDIYIGESIKVDCEIYPEITTDKIKLEYECSRPGIVEIDSDGKLTGIASGQVEVNIKAWVVDEQGEKIRELENFASRSYIYVSEHYKLEEGVDVTFNAEGAYIYDNDMMNGSYDYGKESELEVHIWKIYEDTIDMHTATKEGYYFRGWYLDKECTKPYIYGPDFGGDSLELYAKFDKLDEYYTLTYVADKAVFYNPQNKRLSNLVSVKVPIGEYAEGVILKYDNTPGLLVETEDGYKNIFNYTRGSSFFYNQITNKDTIVRIKSFDGYMLTLDANGGKFADGTSVKIENKGTHTYYNLIGLERPLSKDDGEHTFIGWYYDKECTRQINDEDHLDEDITLYARYSDTPQKAPKPRFNGRYITISDYLLAGKQYLCLWVTDSNNNKIYTKSAITYSYPDGGYHSVYISDDLSDYTTLAGEYTMHVNISSKADDYSVNDNTYSELIKVGYNRLEKPKNLRVEDEILMWDVVEGAKAYVICYYSIPYSSSNNNAKRHYVVCNDNSFDLKVLPVDGDISKYVITVLADSIKNGDYGPEGDDSIYPSENAYYTYSTINKKFKTHPQATTVNAGDTVTFSIELNDELSWNDEIHWLYMCDDPTNTDTDKGEYGRNGGYSLINDHLAECIYENDSMTISFTALPEYDGMKICAGIFNTGYGEIKYYSDEAVLTVIDEVQGDREKSVIKTQPISKNTSIYNTLEFSLELENEMEGTQYYWQEKTQDGWNTIRGGKILSITSNCATMRTFRCVVKNGNIETISEEVIGTWDDTDIREYMGFEKNGYFVCNIPDNKYYAIKFVHPNGEELGIFYTHRGEYEETNYNSDKPDRIQTLLSSDNTYGDYKAYVKELPNPDVKYWQVDTDPVEFVYARGSINGLGVDDNRLTINYLDRYYNIYFQGDPYVGLYYYRNGVEIHPVGDYRFEFPIRLPGAKLYDDDVASPGEYTLYVRAVREIYDAESGEYIVEPCRPDLEPVTISYTVDEDGNVTVHD